MTTKTVDQRAQELLKRAAELGGKLDVNVLTAPRADTRFGLVVFDPAAKIQTVHSVVYFRQEASAACALRHLVADFGALVDDRVYNFN